MGNPKKVGPSPASLHLTLQLDLSHGISIHLNLSTINTSGITRISTNNLLRNLRHLNRRRQRVTKSAQRTKHVPTSSKRLISTKRKLHSTSNGFERSLSRRFNRDNIIMLLMNFNLLLRHLNLYRTLLTSNLHLNLTSRHSTLNLLLLNGLHNLNNALNLVLLNLYLLLATMRLNINLLTSLNVRLTLLSLNLLNNRISRLLLTNSLNVNLKLLSLLNTRIHLSRANNIHINNNLIDLNLRLKLYRLRLIITLNGNNLNFSFLLIHNRNNNDLHTKSITLNLNLNSKNALFRGLLLLSTSNFGGTIIITRNIRNILSILRIRNRGLRTRLNRIKTYILRSTSNRLLTIYRSLIRNRLKRSLARITLRRVISLFVSIHLIRTRRIQSHNLLTKVSMLTSIIVSNITSLLIQSNKILTMSLSNSSTIRPRKSTLLNFGTHFQHFRISFRRTRIRTIYTLRGKRRGSTTSTSSFQTKRTRTYRSSNLNQQNLLMTRGTRNGSNHNGDNDGGRSRALIPPSRRVKPRGGQRQWKSSSTNFLTSSTAVVTTTHTPGRSEFHGVRNTVLLFATHPSHFCTNIIVSTSLICAFAFT